MATAFPRLLLVDITDVATRSSSRNVRTMSFARVCLFAWEIIERLRRAHRRALFVCPSGSSIDALLACFLEDTPNVCALSHDVFARCVCADKPHHGNAHQQGQPHPQQQNQQHHHRQQHQQPSPLTSLLLMLLLILQLRLPLKLSPLRSLSLRPHRPTQQFNQQTNQPSSQPIHPPTHMRLHRPHD